MFAKLSQIGFIDEVESCYSLLKRFTKDELETLKLERSWDWCGTNWEQKDKARIERILADRTPRTPAKKPLLKKIFPFL